MHRQSNCCDILTMLVYHYRTEKIMTCYLKLLVLRWTTFDYVEFQQHSTLQQTLMNTQEVCLEMIQQEMLPRIVVQSTERDSTVM